MAISSKVKDVLEQLHISPKEESSNDLGTTGIVDLGEKIGDSGSESTDLLLGIV